MVEMVAHGLFDEARRLGRGQAVLGLALELRIADEHREHQLRRSEEHTSEHQSLMRSSYAVYCLTKKNKHTHNGMSTHEKDRSSQPLSQNHNTKTKSHKRR